MQISSRVVVAVAFILVGLLVLVAVVGLIRNQIDPTALSIALLPVITGLLVGAGVRFGGNNKDPEK